MLRKMLSISAVVSSFLEKVVKWVSIAVLVVLISVVFFQVVSRVLTGKSFVEIEEFSLIMASWLAFFTVAYSARKKVHVRIDVFSNLLPEFYQHILMMLITGITFVVSGYLVRYGYLLAMKKVNVPLSILPIHAGSWYFSFPAGMLCTCLFLFDNFLQELSQVVGFKKRNTAKEVV